VLERVIVVGASLAGLRAAQALRAEGFTGALTIVGDEPHPPYRRPPLSKELLSGAIDSDDLLLGIEPDLDAQWLLGRPAAGLDLDHRQVVLEDGERLGFDGLVIATGAKPKRLPMMPPLAGIHVLRTLGDATRLRSELIRGRPKVVVVGAGFIGTEVASTCHALGIQATVVDPLPYPVASLGRLVGRVCADVLRDHGVDLRMRRSVVGTEGSGRVERVHLSDGSTIAADVVVLGIGVAPATGWLRDSGLLLDDGVVCDETLAARGAEGIVAAGDVVRWPHPLFRSRRIRLEHWTNAVEQGAAAARRLLASADRGQPFADVPSMWSEQFGLRIQSFGVAAPADDAVVMHGSLEERRFVVAYLEQGRVVGAVGFGMPRALAAAKTLVARRASADEIEIHAVRSGT